MCALSCVYHRHMFWELLLFLSRRIEMEKTKTIIWGE